MNYFCIFFISLTFTICATLELNKTATIPSLSTHTQPGLPGGKSPENLSDKSKLEEVTNLAERALLQLESNANDTLGTHRVIRIKEATTQVVAGFSHEIVFYVGQCGSNATDGNFTTENETLSNSTSAKHHSNVTSFLTKDEKSEKNTPCLGNCTHNATESLSPHCSINDSGPFAICWVKILDQPWMHTFKVKPYQCKEVSKEEAYSSFEN